MILGHGISNGVNNAMRWYSGSGGIIDTGANSARRDSFNGGADIAGTSTAITWDCESGNNINDYFGVGHISNYATKEKLGIFQQTRTVAGAANAPDRTESYGKHAQTSVAFDSIRLNASDVNGWGIGSEVVVLGYDPADTHTDNFWTELDDKSWVSGGDITSNTFTAKKYLWVQWWTVNDATVGQSAFEFNADTGANYADRYSRNGGADATDPSNTHILIDSASTASKLTFGNMFIINASAREKLAIINHMDYGASGSGTSPNREENVGKWTNTASQITSIKISRSAGNMSAGQMKIWGSD